MGIADWIKSTYGGSNAAGSGDTSAFTQVDAMGNQTGVPVDTTPKPASPGAGAGRGKINPPAAKPATKPTNVTQGTAEPTPTETKATADPAATTPKVTYQIADIPNPLTSYASYSTLWTMACLTPDQFNNPATYRYNDSALTNVVFSEAGHLDENRVKTAYGSPEYFINNFEFISIIVPSGPKTGTGNSMNFKFNIYEPLSMGLFLQSLQAAALNAGYPNYLNNAVYVLKLDFVGWDVNGTNKVIPSLTRYFPIKLVTLKFDVSEKGSDYTVSAIPYNQSGFSNIVDVLNQDYVLKGGNVKDLLVAGPDSLAVALTKESARLAKSAAGIGIPDVYVITFPDSKEPPPAGTANNVRGATVTPGASSTSIGSSPGSSDFGDNPIGKASMGFDMTSGGTPVTPTDVDVYNNGYVDKTKVTIDPKSRTFSFGQGQKITDVITQIVLSSDYVRNSVTSKVPADGLIDWFKVDVQIQLKEFDPVRNEYAKTIIYRVVPYKIHHSLVKKPTSGAIGYDALKKKIAKAYDYLYTGGNNDILKFDLTFNTSFYTAIQPALLEEGASKDPATNAGADKEESKITYGAGKSTGAIVSKMGERRVIPTIDGSVYRPGGAKADDVATAVARDFHNAFLNSNTDLLSIDFDILGDAYYIADSGLGNYFSTSLGNGTTDDGAMSYEGAEVLIYLSFRTPVDIKDGGPFYNFPNGGQLSPFSGIYRVLQITSRFADGIFKQTIKAIRYPGQPEDSGTDEKISSSGSDASAAQATGKVFTSDNSMADKA